ncbi:hypothetical protein HZC09_02505 [Candidatus Micrarchaeota archaeon]|nr:hypothetical protein [Candidatus Micrarchaeota archaeon]
MRANTPADSRVLSWWDYGHWTTFLGDRNTVLNPSNNYPSFDQGVAQAFVNGEDKDLYEIMEYHHATHVMVDWELVHKWGALVFLSGTCSSKESPVCPQTAAIPWEPGPGKSQYELEHYFEYLQVGGQCPASLSPVPLMLIQSGYGPIYCAGQDEYFLATQSGLNTSYSRKYKILGRDQLASVSSEFSYLVPWSDNKLLNLNPYLEPLGTKSSLLRSAFVRMFFFNEFPGFKLVHSSPNGLVKIFEYTGKPKGV